MIRYSEIVATVAATMLLCVPASAKDAIDPASYPQLTPKAVLPAILAELRHTLPDVYSVREVRICPATHIKLKEGVPSDWAINFEYNAKTETGGYGGIKRDIAIFRNRRIAYPIGNGPQLGRQGLDGLFSKMVDKQMMRCTPVPDTVVQKLLAPATQ